MMQLYPDPDSLKHAQDSIQNYLVNYEKKMWVPTREEIIAQREERERLASGDTIATREDNAEVKKSAARSSRARKATKTKAPKKVKEAKPKSSPSSSATRSVRRRK